MSALGKSYRIKEGKIRKVPRMAKTKRKAIEAKAARLAKKWQAKSKSKDQP